LIGAGRVKVEEQAVTGEICAQTAPVAGELGSLPDISEFRAGDSKYWPIVEKGQETGARSTTDLRVGGVGVVRC
jgi:hypothetical protein